MDSSKTVEELKSLVKDFCETRDWDQFHSMKELAIGISTEANELLQLFRFKTPEQMIHMQETTAFVKIKEELADTLYFVLRFAQIYDIDLSEELLKKISKNEEKYPIKESKGSNKKYNE